MAPNMLNRAKDLKLIALVEQNPVLYNSSHGKYMDVDTREVTWHKIGDTWQAWSASLCFDTALEFAAIQCQIHFGDYNEEKHKLGLIENLSEYLPPAYSSRSAERKILKMFSKHQGLPPLTAKHLYIRTARALPTYGVTFFLVKEIQKGKKKMVPRLLGINSESILRLDENTKEILQVWPLSHVKSYHMGSKDIFSLNFGDYSSEEYSVKTSDALRIRDILEGYIDIIRKRLCRAYSRHHDDSGAISQEEVCFSRGNIITHVVSTPSKVVEQTFVGPSKILPFEQGSDAATGTQVMTVQQLIVTNKGSTAQQILTGEVPLRSDMSLNVVKKLNHMNSNAVRVVTMLGEITEQNAEEIRNIIASMQQDMPTIQSGINETAEKQTSEEARKRILSELKQLEDLLDKLGNAANKNLMDNEEAMDQARQIADLTTKMYFSLDPKSKRGSQLLRQSRQSFIADEKLEITLRRASFIAAAGGASHAVDTAADILTQPYRGSALSPPETDALGTAAVDKLGKLNAAVALFLVSHADPKNRDYATAVNSMNTIKELLPELATDAQSISHAKGVEAGQEILGGVGALCDAARNIGLLTGCDDRDKIQEAATIFADVSGKLVYILGSRNPRVNADKENELMELAKQVGDMATVLLMKANELTEEAQNNPGAEAVDVAGVNCADAARDLLACAQLTAPTIREAHCQSALTAAAEALTSAERNLTRAWKPLVESQDRQNIGSELAACNLDLDKAIERLKSAYAGLEDMQVEDNDLSPEHSKKLQFITSVKTARETLQLAIDDLNKPNPEATVTEAQVNRLHDSISQKMAHTNACVAALLQAKSEAGNPDYSTADDAVATIAELIPQVVEDARRLISKEDGGAMVNDIHTWCRAVDGICATAASDDTQELKEAAMKFAEASKKLSFVFGPRVRGAREQLMMELFTSAHKQAMDMVDDTHKMADTAGGANGVKLRDLGTAVHSSARALHNTVMVTAPTIQEERCRSLVISQSESLQGAADRLFCEVTALQDDETGCRVLSAQLQEHRAHIANHAAALNNTLAAVKQKLDDTSKKAVRGPPPPVPVKNSTLSKQHSKGAPTPTQLHTDIRRATHHLLHHLRSDASSELKSKSAMGTSEKDHQKAEKNYQKEENDGPNEVKNHHKTKKDRQRAEKAHRKGEEHHQKSEKHRHSVERDYQNDELDCQKAEKHRQSVERDYQNDELDCQKAEKHRQSVERDYQNDELDCQKAEKHRQSVERVYQNDELDCQKAEKHRQSVERDYQNDELDCQKAEKHRQSVERDYQNDELDCQKAEKHRQSVERDYQNDELDCQKAEKHRQSVERDYQNDELDCQKAEKDRQNAERDRQKAEMARQNEEKLAKTIDVAEQYLMTAEKDVDNLMSAKSVGPALGVEQEVALRKQVEQKLGVAALAAASLVGNSHSDATDHSTTTQAVDNLSQIIPDLVKDVTLLSNSLDNKERKRLLDCIKALCEASSRLVRSAKDSTEELNGSAIEFGDKMAGLLYLVCAEVDPVQEKDVIERARAIADGVSRLATSGAEVAQAVPALTHTLCDTGRMAAEAARTFVYTAKLVAPTIQHEQCQKSLIAASEQLSSSLKEYAMCWEHISSDDENFETIAKMSKEAAGLEKLLEAFKQDLSEGKLVKRRLVEEIKVEDTPLRQLVFRIKELAQLQSENPSLSNTTREAFSEYAQALGAAMRALDIAHSRCDPAPQDVTKQQELENAVQNLEVILLQSLPSIEDTQQNNIVDLNDFVKYTSKAAEKFMNSLLKIKAGESKKEIEVIKEDCNAIISSASRLLEPNLGYQGGDNGSGGILEVEQFTQECDVKIANINSTIDSITDNDTKKSLKRLARPLTENCNFLRKLLHQTQLVLEEMRSLDGDDGGPMTWVAYNTVRRNITDAFRRLLENLQRNGEKAGLVEVEAEIEEEPAAPIKSFVQIQEDTARKWLQRRPSNSEVSTAGHESITALIDIAHNMYEDMEDQEKQEMQNVIRESRQLLNQCTHKYDTDTASALLECVRELRRAIEKCAVSHVVEDFLNTEEPLQGFEVILDAEKDATKRAFLLERKIAELMSQLGRVKRVAGIVVRTGHANGANLLEECTKQTELLAPLLVKAAQERVASPNDEEAVSNYKSLLAQYSEALTKVRHLCDTAVDPLHFVQTAGEAIVKMREESARRNDPQLCTYTSKAITRLANRVITVGMASDVARADPALHGALADAQGKLTAVTVNGQAHGPELKDWTQTTEEILKTTAEVESALGGENIFKKLPEPDQPIYNAALSLHSAVRGWSARDNEIVGVAKRMAVLMARLSDQMNEERKRELLVTSKSIVVESREVAATARRLAQECPDLRIRNNLLQVCERIPTISGQLKMLTTVKSSALGLQGGEEDREAMNMLVTNAQNLMASVQEVVKAAASASVKIASSRGLKWVRKNY